MKCSAVSAMLKFAGEHGSSREGWKSLNARCVGEAVWRGVWRLLVECGTFERTDRIESQQRAKWVVLDFFFFASSRMRFVLHNSKCRAPPSTLNSSGLALPNLDPSVPPHFTLALLSLIVCLALFASPHFYIIQ